MKRVVCVISLGALREVLQLPPEATILAVRSVDDFAILNPGCAELVVEGIGPETPTGNVLWRSTAKMRDGVVRDMPVMEWQLP